MDVARKVLGPVPNFSEKFSWQPVKGSETGPVFAEDLGRPPEQPASSSKEFEPSLVDHKTSNDLLDKYMALMGKPRTKPTKAKDPKLSDQQMAMVGLAGLLFGHKQSPAIMDALYNVNQMQAKKTLDDEIAAYENQTDEINNIWSQYQTQRQIETNRAFDQDEVRKRAEAKAQQDQTALTAEQTKKFIEEYSNRVLDAVTKNRRVLSRTSMEFNEATPKERFALARKLRDANDPDFRYLNDRALYAWANQERPVPKNAKQEEATKTRVDAVSQIEQLPRSVTYGEMEAMAKKTSFIGNDQDAGSYLMNAAQALNSVRELKLQPKPDIELQLIEALRYAIRGNRTILSQVVGDLRKESSPDAERLNAALRQSEENERMAKIVKEYDKKKDKEAEEARKKGKAKTSARSGSASPLQGEIGPRGSKLTSPNESLLPKQPYPPQPRNLPQSPKNSRPKQARREAPRFD
jgi:hypothetical protein